MRVVNYRNVESDLIYDARCCNCQEAFKSRPNHVAFDGLMTILKTSGHFMMRSRPIGPNKKKCGVAIIDGGMYYQQLMCCNAKETPCQEKNPEQVGFFNAKEWVPSYIQILKISLKHIQKTTTNTILLNQLKQINAIKKSINLKCFITLLICISD